MNKKEENMVFKFVEMVTRATPEELAQINVTSGARRLGVSPARLCRAFKACYICSACHIIMINKQIAFEKLISSHRANTLKEALEILDINSQSNFIKKYKAINHKTPGETIRLLKKAAIPQDDAQRKIDQ